MGFLDKIDNVSGSNVYLVYLCCLVACMSDHAAYLKHRAQLMEPL